MGTVYGWLYVPTGNLFDAEQGATAKAIGDAFGISKEWVRLHFRSNKRPTSRTAIGAMAMLSLLLTMASSAQAEGSWCLNKGGTGGPIVNMEQISWHVSPQACCAYQSV